MSDQQFTEVRPRKPIWQYWHLIYTFGQRDLKSKFKGSALGWVWSLVVPLATLTIYSAVFSIIFRAEPPMMGNGSPGVFVIWLFVGLIFWTFFSNVINNGILELLGAGPILQKVYFPAYAPVLGAGLAVGVQSLIELGILIVIMLVMGNIGWSWLLLIPFIAITVIFVGSVATILAILNVYYRDLAHLVTIALQLLFYVTPIIYPLTMVTQQWRGIDLRAILELNPLTSFVQLFRSLIYELSPGTLNQWGAVTVTAGITLLLAYWVMARKGRDLGENV